MAAENHFLLARLIVREHGLPGRAREASDRSLVRLIALGDRAALEELYARHASALLEYVVALVGDRALAEELVQDTLVAAWRAAGRFEGKAAVRTWLFGIARCQARDRTRGRRLVVTATDDALLTVADDRLGPEALSMARAGAEVLAAKVARLTPFQREVLVLAFVEGWQMAEIAALLDVPIGTVKSRLNSARRALRALLVSEDEDCQR